jgi:hypothetical protein
MTVTLTGTTLNSVYVGQNPPFEVSDLFASGEQGAWYDPSDFTTLFEDSAGTTPITTVERPVGLMLDKSGRGNHAFQTSSAARPALRNRYNQLTFSEEFDNAAWQAGTNFVFSANSLTAPDGTVTADKVILPNGSSLILAGSLYLSDPELSQLVTLVSGVVYTYSVYAKIGEYDHFQLRVAQNTTLNNNVQATALFNLSTGVNVNFVGQTVSSINVGDGWYRLTVTFSSSITGNAYVGGWIWNSTASTGNGVNGVYLWGAQLIVTNSLPSNEYQRIAAAPTVGSAPTYDTDTTKFPPYLQFVTDDAMLTNSINFTATDKATVWAGVRKLSDAAAAVIVESSANSNNNDGVFLLSISGLVGSLGDAFYRVRGTSSAAGFYQSSQDAPATYIQTLSGDIAGANLASAVGPRYNGSSISLSDINENSAGTGNFGNYPLYIGARGGTSLFLNGYIYGLIIRGAQTDPIEIQRTEAYLAAKMQVTL